MPHPYQHNRQHKEPATVECHPDFNTPPAKPKRPISLYRVTCQESNIQPGFLKEAVVIASSADHAKMNMHLKTGYTAERIPGVECNPGQEGQVLMAIYYAPAKE